MLEEIAITMIKGIGDITIRNLLNKFGDVREIFRAKQAHLESIPGIGTKTAQLITNHSSFEAAEKELSFVEKYNINPLFISSPDYPKRLRNCADAPALLYYKGNADLNNQKVVAIVGTRNATSYGKGFCDNLLEELKSHDLLVVSGLAYGIDIAAHKASLNNGISTIGVLGHGLDRIYPSVHRSAAEQMLECGGLLTEFPSGTNPDRQNFPKRNRIIAGMADATIVVEATINGGALITAEIANSYNRDVFAVPGKINDEFSVGCNFLIKTNRANLLTKYEDLEYIMGWTAEKNVKKNPQLELIPDLNTEELKIYELIKERGQIAIDDLQNILNVNQSKLAIVLLNLEMRSIIVSLPGKIYRLN